MNRATSEHELIARCRQGDESAFGELVDQYKGMVFALTSRSAATRERAEDLAQEVFLRVHRGLPYFRGEAKLSTWIYRIVINLLAQERSVPVAESLDAVADGEDTPRLQPGAAIRPSATWLCVTGSTRPFDGCRRSTRC